jgi:hypothetical protein
MKFVSLFLVFLLFLVGCSSKSEQLLSEPPITLKEPEVGKYWVATKEDISFRNHLIPPKVSGFVKVKYLIDSNGKVFNPIVAESEGGWDKFALRAVKEFDYINTEFNSNKTPVYAIKHFSFTAP